MLPNTVSTEVESSLAKGSEIKFRAKKRLILNYCSLCKEMVISKVTLLKIKASGYK